MEIQHSSIFYRVIGCLGTPGYFQYRPRVSMQYVPSPASLAGQNTRFGHTGLGVARGGAAAIKVREVW